MAVRLLTYVGLLYRDLIVKSNRPVAKTPPVLPIVLYNGKKPWKAAAAAGVNCCRLAREQLQDFFQPTLKYVLIDEQELHHGRMERLENLTATGYVRNWRKC